MELTYELYIKNLKVGRFRGIRSVKKCLRLRGLSENSPIVKIKVIL